VTKNVDFEAIILIGNMMK